ncbi:regulation of nuclear pre-mRNA domain-containing protein 1B-like [Bolinopsis microptera]|uniref:regulation of nuclear pre-mRNA domain-containing protein 1B-like n=1 Tax=Bolinopsis microptera TaxID=2820187 RepID=UPI0030797E64
MSFNTGSFVGKLIELNNSQQSIQTLSGWAIHHRRNAQQIVDVWFQQLTKSPKERKLLFMFLSNDIIQNSKRKGNEFTQEFSRVLPDALSHTYKSAVEDLKTIKQIDRILQIWKEREIFGKDFIDKLQSYRPKGLRSESQSEDTTDGTLMSPTKKRIRSTSDSAPDPDTVIRSLINLERGSALQDTRIKQQFSTIPNEVWNVQAVEKITDRKRLETLLKSVDSSYELLSQHRIRLQTEFQERNKVAAMLKEFVMHQKEQLRSVESRLTEYQGKLQKVQAVRSQLQSHLNSLPDLTTVTKLEPLPEPGSLFGAPDD